MGVMENANFSLNDPDIYYEAKQMIYRIEVGLKPDFKDSRGEKVKGRVAQDLGLFVDSIRITDVYTIDATLSRKQVELVANECFTDPVIQQYSLDQPLRDDFHWLVEVGYRPGVTDNVGRTAKEAVETRCNLKLGKQEGVYTSRRYLINGKINRAEVEMIARGVLGNELIEHFEIIDEKTWNQKEQDDFFVPRVFNKEKAEAKEVELNISDQSLMDLSRDRTLALNLSEMKAIKNYLSKEKRITARKKWGLGSRITDVELESLAQTWSEHCKHKIFSAIIEYIDDKGNRVAIDSLFDTYIKGSTEKIRKGLGEQDYCLSVFKDNAGVIKFNEKWSLVFKVETHNTPSALDPYGGALTGIVGVNRDVLGTGKGARLIFNTDIFCFAPPDYSKPLPPRLLHPRRIYEGVREGVEHGGNKSGIPTVNGGVVFDERYLGKPLVYCGTGGIMPGKTGGDFSHNKKALSGDLIVMTGGRIGKDGIHGATFSSEEIHGDSPTSAVQIGDPITQKRMADFLLKARDLGLYRSITDNGAGGLSSSVGEMAQDCNGCRLNLDMAPLKYAGLSPWEILLSEAQERMTLAVSPDKIEELLKLSEKMQVETTVLGEFIDSGFFHVLYRDQTVAYLEMYFLHNGLPRLELKAKWEKKKYPEPDFEDPPDLTSILKKVLSRWNICSKESIIRQYDHEVQGGSVIKPLVGAREDGPGDAAVLRPLLDSLEGVVVSHGICPRYGDIDTYHMMACAIDEAVRNLISVGGSLEIVAGLDNFCWCDPIKSEKTPDGEYKLAQLVRANMALYDYTVSLGIPCISGKDSMKNDYQIEETKISVPPTILFSLIGKIEDVRQAITMDVKNPGDLVYITGETREEMGGSEYFAALGFIGNEVPRVDAEKAKRSYRAIIRTVKEGLIASCHDCSDGGLGVALAETAFAGGYGMKIDLRKVPAVKIKRNDTLFFSESQTRFVITVKPENKDRFEGLMKDVNFAEIGTVLTSDAFEVLGLQGRIIVNTIIHDLKESWQKPLR